MAWRCGKITRRLLRVKAESVSFAVALQTTSEAAQDKAGVKRLSIRENCTTKQRDFISRCARCAGFAHLGDTCSSEVVLEVEPSVARENPVAVTSKPDLLSKSSTYPSP